ncbi:hypothetical protein LCGC14_1495670 [marine sediment metagenome]|uniref:Uncharacterized protein n=1 Tax=marine sediment metagenome TaxID=412755 RepID=A0A0F9J5I1_9ZZZZ
MTLEEMYNDLEWRLRQEDDDRVLPPAYLTHLLNRAQRYVVMRVDEFLVPELINSSTSNDISGGTGFDITTLDPLSLDGEKGIISVKLTSGKYARRIFEQEIRANEDVSLTYSTQDPRFYFRGNTLYVLPYASASIDIRYKGKPEDMWVNAQEITILGSASTSIVTATEATPNPVLAAVADTYNGDTLYLKQFHTKYTVEDHATAGGVATFTIRPAAQSAITVGGTFILQSGDFFKNITTGFSIETNINCELEETVQDLMLDVSEVMGLRGINRSQAQLMWQNADARIRHANKKYKPVPTTYLEVGQLVNVRPGKGTIYTGYN